MFNISFGEVVVVAVIGLIVIGPRRLPETARFLGHLASRVQRQVAGVKADIRREMDLEDLKSIHREYETAARDISGDFQAQARAIQSAADSAGDAARATESAPAADGGAAVPNSDSTDSADSDSVSDSAAESAGAAAPTQWPGNVSAPAADAKREDAEDGAATKDEAKSGGANA